MRKGVRRKLGELKALRPKETEEVETVKEVATFMKEQEKVEQAISSLEDAVGGEDDIADERKAHPSGVEDHEEDTEPAEERMRPRQDKNTHRLKMLGARPGDRVSK